MEWFEELDFDENPLSTDPSEFLDSLIALQGVIDELAYRVEAGSMVFIEGLDGSGKTSLLWTMIERFKGEERVIFVDAGGLEKGINIENVMKKRYGLLRRIFGSIPRNMILLVDNIQNLSRKNAERIKYYFDYNYIQAVVFTSISYSKTKLPKSIKDRIGRRVIRLGSLSSEQAIEAVKRRLQGSNVLPAPLISKLFEKSNKNMKTLLENCEKVLEATVEAGKEHATNEELKKVAPK